MIDKGLTYAYAEGGPVASEGRPRPNPFVRPMPNGKPVYNNITVDGFVGGPAVLPQQPVFGRRDHLDGPDRNQRHPRPILYFGPDGQPVYDNITVGGAAVMPEAIRRAVSNLDPEAAARAERIWASSIDPGGDFGLPPPVQETPVSGGIFGSLPVADPVAPPPPLGRMEPIIDYFDENGKRVFVGIDGRFPQQPVVPPPIQPVVPPPVTGPDGTSRTYSPPIFSRPSAADTRAAGYDAAIQRFANLPFVRPEGIMGLQRGKLRLS